MRMESMFRQETLLEENRICISQIGQSHIQLGGRQAFVDKAGVITNMTMSSAGQTNSVLFLEIMEKYDSTITTGSYMFMGNVLLFSISAVLTATFLIPTIKERRCLILGGLLCSALSLGASLAPNIGTFGAIIALKGIGHGIILVPSLALIPHYFKRLRSRASVAPWCGGSAGAIIAPFIIRAVRKEYGVSGAFFLLSAVELHYILAGLLLRPPSAYKYHPDQTDGSVENNVPQREGSVTADTELGGIPEEAVSSEKVSQLVQVISTEHVGEAESVSDSLLSQPEARDKLDELVHRRTRNRISESRDEAKDKETPYRERRNTFYGSALTLDSDIGVALELMLEDATDSPSEKSLGGWRKHYQDCSLELWSFRWAILSMIPGSVNIYLTTYIPTICKFQGSSLDQAALLVTIMGCVDLVSRMFYGVIADTQIILPSNLLALAQLCLGVICHMFRFTSSFVTLVPVIIGTGLFIGSRGPMQSLVCIQVVGVHKMARSYSIMSMLNTLIGPMFNPIFGKIVEATNSFVLVMHIMGCCYFLSVALMALIPLFERLDVKHGRRT